jgi:RecB family exonuclease
MRDGDKITGTEMPFSLPLPGVETKMIGVMDLVIKHNEDTLEVIDYKSGKKTQTTDECMRDIQTRMYSLACRRLFIDDVLGLGYKYKNVILTFDYFTNMPITVAFSEEEDNKTEQYVKKMVKEIEEMETVTRIAGERGNFDWRCQYMCDIDVCEKNWKGTFRISDEQNSEG